MSIEEMYAFCVSISPYQLRVHVRLKNQQDVLEGKITRVEPERFQLQTDDKVVSEYRFCWVARIKSA